MHFALMVADMVFALLFVGLPLFGFGSAPASFDCGMRRLAYDYGRQLLPREGSFESLYYALNLNSPDCHAMLSKLDDLPSRKTSLIPSDAIYVDPDRGHDGSSGSLSSPMKTLQAGVVAAGRAGSKAVILRDGTFYLDAPIVLGPEHSGMTLMAYPGEQPVISGGKRVDTKWIPYKIEPESWSIFNNFNIVSEGIADNFTIRDLGKKVNAESCQQSCAADKECMSYAWHDANQGKFSNVCWGRLDGQWTGIAQRGHISGRRSVALNIWKANLEGQVKSVPGLQVDGARATRARYPNLPAGIEVTPGYGNLIDSSGADWTPPDFNKYGKVHFYTDTVGDHRRNNTPDNWFQEYMIGVGGLCSVYDPPVSYWCSEHPSGGGAFAFRTPSGMTPKPNTLPHSPYSGDLSEAVINVWRPARWANWMFNVADYDQKNNNFTFGHGGNQGARGENFGGDWFIENVFEELDHPGEFYFDKSLGDLYLNYNGTGAPPASAEVVVPHLRVLFNVTGTQWNPVRGLTFDGLTFRSTRYTYMDPHGVPSAGDWALDRTGAVFLQGTESAKIQNSYFERLDGNAVMISGYNRNVTVKDNDFSFIGGNAIASWGYTNETENSGYPYYTPFTNNPQAGVDGTDGNHPRYNIIIGNLAREVGLYEKQSSFYVQAKTAQSTISGNVFFNGPRAGINYNDGFGGGDELSRNLVFSTCRESGDHGPFNSWDRQPFLTTVRTGEPSMVMAWREIHHNFFIDNYSPQENIDNDDGSCYFKSHHNFLVYGDNGMKNDFGGHDNHHFHNIYAYAGQALGVDGTLQGHEDHFYNNLAVLTGNTVGHAQCGSARTQMSNNTYFTPSGNIQLCGKPLADAQDSGMDLGSTVSKMPTDETILGWANTLLDIRSTDMHQFFI